MNLPIVTESGCVSRQQIHCDAAQTTFSRLGMGFLLGAARERVKKREPPSFCLPILIHVPS